MVSEFLGLLFDCLIISISIWEEKKNVFPKKKNVFQCLKKIESSSHFIMRNADILTILISAKYDKEATGSC